MEINMQKQIASKEKEVNDILGKITEAENNSIPEKEYEIKRKTGEIELLKREQRILTDERKSAANGTYQSRSLSEYGDDIREAKEKTDKIKDTIRKLSTITADESGTIVKIYAEEGDSYDGSSPLYAIMPDYDLTIEVTLDEETENHLKEGTEADFAYSRHRGKGVVIRIDEEYGDSGIVKTAVLEPSEEFMSLFKKPGELGGKSVSVEYSRRGAFGMVTVPNSAVFEEQGEKKVYLVKSRKGFWGTENYVVPAKVDVKDTDPEKSSVTGIMVNEEIAVGWDRVLESNQRIIRLVD